MSAPQLYSLSLIRLQFIETAEQREVWYTRARRQWGAGKLVSMRLSNSKKVIGAAPPRHVDMKPLWCGVDYQPDAVSYNLFSLQADSIIVFELICVEVVPPHVLGLAVVNLQSFLSDRRTYGKNSIHIYPSMTYPLAVHAILDFEIRADNMKIPSDNLQQRNQISPLEYSFGCVRVSALDLYFPSFLVDNSKSGEFIVSNIICVFNSTEETNLTLSITQWKSSIDPPVVQNEPGSHAACGQLTVHPLEPVLVRPQQRAYFSITWSVTTSMQMHQIPEVELVVSGDMAPTCPILFRVHFTSPRPDDLDCPFQYWVNTTCLTNRALSLQQELPYIRSLLPVFAISHQKEPFSNNSFDKEIVVTDRDSGASIILGSKLPINAESLAKISSGPTRDVDSVQCDCLLELGTLVGFPLLSSSSHVELAPSFRISATLLKTDGWRLLDSETACRYQTQSGRVHFVDVLRMTKLPHANVNQFLKLNLLEVSPRDGDETPIGTALVSLGSLTGVAGPVRACASFYIYDSYTAYDDLSQCGVLLKGCAFSFL